MGSIDRVGLTRRDMLRLTAGGAGMFMLTASGLAVSSCGLYAPGCLDWTSPRGQT